MKKYVIIAASAILLLGIMAFAQRGEAQQPQQGNSQPAVTQSAPDDDQLAPGAGQQDDFDLTDVGEDADDMFSDGGPMMATGPGGAAPGGGMGACGMGRPGGMMRGGMRHPGMRGGMMMGMMAEKLELTDAQKDQFKKLRADFQLAQVDKRAELQKAQIRLRELMRDEKSSEADVSRGIDDVARLRADMAKARFSHMRQMRGVLTDKQLDMLKSMRQQRMQSMFNGRGNRGGDSTQPGPGMRRGRGM